MTVLMGFVFKKDMQMIRHYIGLWTIILISGLIQFGCEEPAVFSEDPILIQVADLVVTVSDFKAAFDIAKIAYPMPILRDSKILDQAMIGVLNQLTDELIISKRAEELGAGALLPTSMDADGTQNGYDIPMTKAIADAVSLPVIASGGAGTLEHLYEAISEGHADAVLVASIAHFGKYTIKEMKEYLAGRGIPVKT